MDPNTLHDLLVGGIILYLAVTLINLVCARMAEAMYELEEEQERDAKTPEE